MIDGKPINFQVLDEHTLKATLPKPFSPFLSRISMEILPKHLLEDIDINTATFNQQPVGTGPFKFAKWSKGQYITLTRNDNYYGDKPKLQQVFYRIIPDSNTALVSMKKGEIDTTGVLPKDFEKIGKNERFNSFKYSSLSYSYLGFNLKKEPFTDLKHRQVINHAIDKDQIVKIVLKGFGRPAFFPSSPVSWAYPSDESGFEYNPEKSQQLLKEMGYSFNEKTKLMEKAGQPFEFDLITSKSSKISEKMAQVIQRYLLDVGIKMNIQLMEWKSFLKILNGKPPKKFDAVMLSWSLGVDPDAYSIWHSTQFPVGFNFVGYSNKDVDKLLEQGRLEFDQMKRKEIYNRLFRMISEDVPYVFLTHSESLVAINKRVQGLSEPGPTGIMNPIENVFIDAD